MDIRKKMAAWKATRINMKSIIKKDFLKVFYFSPFNSISLILNLIL